MDKLFENFLQISGSRGTVIVDDGIPSSSSPDNVNNLQNRVILNKNNCLPTTNNVDSESNLVIAEGNIGSIAFKAPQSLFNQNPNVWFQILEQQFSLSGIKSENTKYSHAVNALDSRHHNTFADVILRDKGQLPYTTFRNEVIRVLGESESARVNNVLHGLSLGDKKPSQLLNEFRLNAGSTFSEKALQQLWLKRLPQQVQIILSTFANDVSLTVLAERADKMLEVMEYTQISEIKQTSSTNSVFNSIKSNPAYSNSQCSTIPNSYSDLETRFDQFRTQILSEVSAVCRPGARSSSNSRDAPRESSRSRSRIRFNPKYDQCFYHYKFLNKARHCFPGCKFFEEFSKSNF